MVPTSHSRVPRARTTRHPPPPTLTAPRRAAGAHCPWLSPSRHSSEMGGRGKAKRRRQGSCSSEANMGPRKRTPPALTKTPIPEHGCRQRGDVRKWQQPCPVELERASCIRQASRPAVVQIRRLDCCDAARHHLSISTIVAISGVVRAAVQLSGQRVSRRARLRIYSRGPGHFWLRISY